MQEERRLVERAAMIDAGASLDEQMDSAAVSAAGDSGSETVSDSDASDADQKSSIEACVDVREQQVWDLREKSMQTKQETHSSRATVKSYTAYKVNESVVANSRIAADLVN